MTKNTVNRRNSSDHWSFLSRSSIITFLSSCAENCLAYLVLLSVTRKCSGWSSCKHSRHLHSLKYRTVLNTRSTLVFRQLKTSHLPLWPKTLPSDSPLRPPSTLWFLMAHLTERQCSEPVVMLISFSPGYAQTPNSWLHQYEREACPNPGSQNHQPASTLSYNNADFRHRT